MSKQEAPTDRLTRGNLTLDERLERIEQKLDAILEASLLMRVARLETVVYGGCALGLLAIGGALIGLVMKGGQ